MAVAMAHVSREDGHQVALADDQYTVQALATERPDPTLSIGIGPRRLWRSLQHRYPRCGEDDVETGRELRIPITDQEPKYLGPIIQGP
jgi:hypothetical protein